MKNMSKFANPSICVLIFFMCFGCKPSLSVVKYTCSKCGLDKTIRQTSKTGITNLDQKETVVFVTNEVAAILDKGCSHGWIRTGVDFHSGRGGGSASYGGVFEMLRMDTDFIEELKSVEATNSQLAHEIWTTLFTASAKTNEASNIILEWVAEHPEPLLKLFARAKHNKG
jgi:hypothetical protein